MQIEMPTLLEYQACLNILFELDRKYDTTLYNKCNMPFS